LLREGQGRAGKGGSGLLGPEKTAQLFALAGRVAGGGRMGRDEGRGCIERERERERETQTERQTEKRKKRREKQDAELHGI